MKIKFIIIAPTVEATQTDANVKAVAKKADYDCVIVANPEDEAKELNDYFKANVGEIEKKKYTHVCLIPAESTLTSCFTEVMKQYVSDKDTLYLPFVELCNPSEDNTNPEFKALINTSLWKPHGLADMGEMNLNFARAQMDTTLYGALIPVSVFKTAQFKPSIKYYYGYEFLSRIVKTGTVVSSIPKVTFRLIKDLMFKDVENETKAHYFKAAQHECLYNVEREIQKEYKQFTLAPGSDMVATDDFIETVK